MDEEALLYLKDAVESNWIAPVGPHVDGFEEDISLLLKSPHVLATNSGTSAIHLGLLALGVGRGDEVLCSTFTFCASVNPVVYCGATPVFIDSEYGTWNMDPALLEESIRDRTKKTGKKPRAIVLVHLYGMPARLNEVMEIARRYDIPVLEDAAEAFGSQYNGIAVGTVGELGVLSFNGNKIVTASGGGALFSSRTDLIERARYFRQEARENLRYYEHREIGYNYRLSNLLAALGRSQLKVLTLRVKRRREIFQYYKRELEPIGNVGFQEEDSGMKSNRWLTTFLVRDRKTDIGSLRAALQNDSIESRHLWKPMHRQPVFAGCPKYITGVSDDLFAHGLCLPSGSALDGDDLERITAIIRKEFT